MLNSRFLPAGASVVFNFLIFNFSFAAEPLQLSWTNNMLTIAAPWLPGEKIEVWHMEAFCKPGSTKRDWHETADRKSTRLNSSHSSISYAVFCLKKKKKKKKKLIYKI